MVNGKVLDKNVLAPLPKDFVKDEKEWASRNRDQVLISKTYTGSGTTIIHTVPKGKTFFLTNCWISGVNVTAAVGFVSLTISQLNTILVGIEVPATTGNNFGNMTFNMPIKLEEGMIIVMSNFGLGGSVTRAGIYGWVEDKLISGSF